VDADSLALGPWPISGRSVISDVAYCSSACVIWRAGVDIQLGRHPMQISFVCDNTR